VALALDRQERGQGERSAVQEVESAYGLRCISILTLAGLIEALSSHNTRGAEAAQLAALRAYRQTYGVAD
jgi:orotate phosphoribosyltransferase